MVYLHCGWLKTGTTSLQAALVNNQERLAAGGLLYPRRWRRDSDGSHNDLIELLEVHKMRGSALSELSSLLSANADRDILFSSESLTVWLLLWDREYEFLLELVSAMQEVMPVRCIFTLRRFDEVFHSFCRQMALRRGLGESITASMLDTLRTDELFTRMRGLEEHVGGDVAYVRYDCSGGHNIELLRAFDIPADVVYSIGRELEAAPRRNTTATHKQIVAAENVAAISARAGVTLDRAAMRRAFEQEGFQFDDDGPCVLFDRAMELRLRESVLESALDCGFMPYVRFFGDEKPDNPLPVTPMEPDVLTDEDVARLATHIQRAKPVHDAA